jgi:hypothetical protein
MAPVVHGLEQLYAEEVNFVVLDIDKTENDEYGPFVDALGYSPRIRPGIFILDPTGNVIQFWLGAVDGKIIQQVIVDALATY